MRNKKMRKGFSGYIKHIGSCSSLSVEYSPREFDEFVQEDFFYDKRKEDYFLHRNVEFSYCNDSGSKIEIVIPTLYFNRKLEPGEAFKIIEKKRYIIIDNVSIKF